MIQQARPAPLAEAGSYLPVASDDLDVLVVVAVGNPGTSRTKRWEAVANVASALAMYEAPGFYEDGLLLVTSDSADGEGAKVQLQSDLLLLTDACQDLGTVPTPTVVGQPVLADAPTPVVVAEPAASNSGEGETEAGTAAIQVVQRPSADVSGDEVTAEVRAALAELCAAGQEGLLPREYAGYMMTALEFIGRHGRLTRYYVVHSHLWVPLALTQSAWVLSLLLYFDGRSCG